MSNHPLNYPRFLRHPSQACKPRTAILKSAFAIAVAGWFFATSPAHASNIIQNPGFEANNSYGYFGSGTIPIIPGNWTWGSPGNGGFWVQTPDSTDNPHSGNVYFKEWGAYQGIPTTNNVYQDNACGAGATYTCDFYAGSDDTAFTANPARYGFAYVSFLDANSNVLALYSAPNYDVNFVNNNGGFTNTTSINWYHFYVTNQNDPVSGAVTGAVSTLTAPTGAHTVRFTWGNWQLANDSGNFGLDDVNLNQTGGPVAPQITQVYPGNLLFASNYISFHVTSATSTPTTNSAIHLTVDGVAVPNGSMTFSGSSPDITVTYTNIPDNTWDHTASITAQDSLGLAAPPQSFAFDTIHPAFVVEFEDYDFTNAITGAESYYNNPTPTSTAQANSYFGVAGNPSVDYFTTSGPYSTAFRPLDTRNISVTGDYARPQYLTAQVSDPAARDWEIDNINNGDWGNYTRNYPSGSYNVYARVSGNGGTLTKLSLDYISGGTVVSNVGVFTFTGEGWGVWQYSPLLDNNGNLLPVTFSGGVQTLRATLTPTGGLNENFFFLVPAVTGLPFLSGISPADGTLLATNNTFSFTADCTPEPLNTNGIHLLLNGVDVTSSLNISGSTDIKNVSAPLQPNTIYTAVINVTNAVGVGVSRTVNFDTFNPNNLQIEAEDYDFNRGQFIDNPVPTANNINPTNSYYYYAGGNPTNYAVTGVDLTVSNALAGETQLYRPLLTTFPPDETEAGTALASDSLRLKFVNTGQIPGEPLNTTNLDYYVGWWSPGTWLNYTRTFPTNTYVVYGRLANSGPYSGAIMSLVTSGRGTSSQTTQQLGTFSDPTASGFQDWHWVELMSNNQPAVLSLGGVETIKMTAPPGSAGGSLNANFYMFVPVVPAPVLSVSRSGSTISITFQTSSSHSYVVQWTGSLSGTPTWTTLSTITGNGSIQTATDTVGGSTRFYRVQVN